MNAEQLSRQFFNLKEDCKEYYDNLTSQQEEDVILDFEDGYYVDYMCQNKGVFKEALLLKLKKNSLLVNDMPTNKAIHIKFENLTIPDQLTVLKLYEQNQ